MKSGIRGGLQPIRLHGIQPKKQRASQHLGVLNTDGKIYPKALSVECIDGMIWSTVPKIPKRFFLSFVKNYHFADINLFWKDIEKNAVDRAKAFREKYTDNAR